MKAPNGTVLGLLLWADNMIYATGWSETPRFALGMTTETTSATGIRYVDGQLALAGLSIFDIVSGVGR